MGLRLPAALAPWRPYPPKAVPAEGAGEMGSLLLPEQLMTQRALGGKEELLERAKHAARAARRRA